MLRALRRTRQVRQFTAEPVSEADLHAILEVARWTGSSTNRQPWTFILLRKRADRERVAEMAPYARHVAAAAVGIAIAMPGTNPECRTVSDCYPCGRPTWRRTGDRAGCPGCASAREEEP